MRKRLLASLVVTTFLTLIAAGVSAYDTRETGSRCCCCAQAESPFPSIGSRLCCASRCGKKTGDLPSTPRLSVASVPVSDMPVATVYVEPFDDATATRVSTALEALEEAAAGHDPPPIHVRKATYLI